MEKTPFERKSHAHWIGWLIVLSFFFLMFGNWIVSLTHPDEVFYAQIAKEMVEHDTWMVPMIFDQTNFEKPIFTFWLLRLAVEHFGATPYVARFFMSVFGMIGVGMTYFLAYLMFKDKRMAFLSGAMLSTSFIYIVLSRSVMTDMVFSMWVYFALVFFYWGYTRQEHRGASIVLTCVCAGLAVLSKGLLGLLLPMGVISLYLGFQKERKFVLHPSLLLGLGLFALIVIPWHVFMVQKFGQSFINEYWWNVHVRRIFVAEHLKSDTWYFYLMTIFGGTFPWSLFLIPAVVWTVIKVRRHEDERMLGFIWIAIVYIFMSMQIAASKLASYIFPIFPLLAIVLAYYLNEVLKNRTQPFLMRSARAVGFLMTTVCVGGVGAAIYFSHKYRDLVIDVRPVYLFCGFVVICGAVILVCALKKKIGRMLIATGAITGVFLFSLLFAYPSAEPWVTCRQISEEFKKIDQGDSTVVCSKFYVRGIRFFTDRDVAVIDSGDGFFTPHPIPYLNSDNKVAGFLEKQPTTFFIVKESDAEDLRRIAKRFNYDLKFYKEIGGKAIIRLQKKSR